MPTARTARTPTSSTDDLLCCAPLTDAPVSDADAQMLAGVFAALGDPVRLRLLSIVATQGEVCSCHLEGPLGKSQPTVSHHTRILAAAGLSSSARSAVAGCGGASFPNVWTHFAEPSAANNWRQDSFRGTPSALYFRLQNPHRISQRPLATHRNSEH